MEAWRTCRRRGPSKPTGFSLWAWGCEMSYALTTLWYERNRFLPGILAVAFSALLIALQCGLLLGLFSITSIPIDHTRADVWVSAPAVLSVDLGRPIDEGSTFATVAS